HPAQAGRRCVAHGAHRGHRARARRRHAVTRIARAALALLALGLAGAAPTPPSYRESIEGWRQERERKLRAEDGWLAVAGLFWLREGESRLGTAAGNDIVLPAGSAPERAGTITLRGGRVTLRLGTEAEREL